MKRALVLVSLLALGACSTGSEPAPAPPPPPVSTAPPPTPEPAPDACGASRHQSLIGRPRSEIPVPIDPQKQRVACTTCPVTMDFNPERLNFYFDSATGIIKKVSCG
jgi:hypothetical protein